MRHNFDCEAMIIHHDSIFLFSKNWGNGHTKIYSLPIKPGDYVAQIKNDYNSDGLITGADYDTKSNTLVLVGYKNYKPFVLIFENCTNISMLSKDYTRIKFPLKYGLQTEAICFDEKGQIFISCEENKYSSNFLFLLRF
jgi:hypothetical protein